MISRVGAVAAQFRDAAPGAVNGGGKVQRGAGEMGDTRYSGYLLDRLLSMDGRATSSGEAGSTSGERRRRLASFSR